MVGAARGRTSPDSKCHGLFPTGTGHHTARHYQHADRPREPVSSHPFIPQISAKHWLRARNWAGHYREPKQTCSCIYGVHGPPREHGRPRGIKESSKHKTAIVVSPRVESFMILRENGAKDSSQSGRIDKSHLSWCLRDEQRWRKRSRPWNSLCKGPVQSRGRECTHLRN